MWYMMFITGRIHRLRTWNGGALTEGIFRIMSIVYQTGGTALFLRRWLSHAKRL